MSREAGLMDEGLQPKRLEEIIREIELTLRKTESFADRNADHSALTDIADYLTQIRVHLTKLLKATAGRADKQGKALKELIARCFRLEGRIKEIRNDTELSGERC